MNWYRDGYGMSGGGILFMGLMWLVIIGFAIWLVTWMTHRDHHHMTSVEKLESPRQILDRRFASGEIDADAYAQSRKLLE